MPEVISEVEHDRLCSECGYNLRGLTTNRCPECGEFFDPKRLRVARIPWLRRAEIGNWNAYWRTVRMVMLHPLVLGHEIWGASVVNPGGAAKFRRTIVTQGVIACEIVVLTLNAAVTSHIEVLLGSLFVTFAVVTSFLVMATDLLHFAQDGNPPADIVWRRALNHYACAPLAIIPIVAALLCVGIVAASAAFGMLALCVTVGMLIWWWVANIAVMHVVFDSLSSSFWNACKLPVLWGILGITAGIFGVLAVMLVVAVISNFR